jgi:16S rRNA processing protein RimM
MDVLPIGYFSKTHGVKGQLILRKESDFFTEKVKVLFIEVSGAKAPYFISELKETNTGMIVSLEDVDSVEKARLLLGKKVFIDSTLLTKEETETDWIGFELVDKHFGSLGKIEQVTDNGQQLLVTLYYKNKEVMLPLVDAFIEKIDEDLKKIFFNAPEGLIDVYLGEM